MLPLVDIENPYLGLHEVTVDLLLDLCVELILLALLLIVGTRRSSWALQLSDVVLVKDCPIDLPLDQQPAQNLGADCETLQMDIGIAYLARLVARWYDSKSCVQSPPAFTYIIEPPGCLGT